MKILLVFNQNAGHGHAGKMLPLVEEALKEFGIEYDLKCTQNPGHGIEIVRDADLTSMTDWLQQGEMELCSKW